MCIAHATAAIIIMVHTTYVPAMMLHQLETGNAPRMNVRASSSSSFAAAALVIIVQPDMYDSLGESRAGHAASNAVAEASFIALLRCTSHAALTPSSPCLRCCVACGVLRLI